MKAFKRFLVVFILVILGLLISYLVYTGKALAALI